LPSEDPPGRGFARTLIAIARQKGVAGYPGDGANRWPAGHTLDVAHLYRLALEDAPAGTRWHAVGDEGAPRSPICKLAQQLSAQTRTCEPDPDPDARVNGVAGKLEANPQSAESQPATPAITVRESPVTVMIANGRA
jgi:nucleoside-diphosphate-sugar epimerase